jgi:hypothetical protein
MKPMNELISKLTGTQALQVLKGMASDDDRLARKIEIGVQELERGSAAGFGRVVAG